MFDLQMEEELERFYKDREKFQSNSNLKYFLDFNLNLNNIKSKKIKLKPPKFKKKENIEHFIKKKDKGLF